jgi:hypothetical protein
VGNKVRVNPLQHEIMNDGVSVMRIIVIIMAIPHEFMKIPILMVIVLIRI